MRWRYADPNDPLESAAKADILARIDQWWAEFARRADDLDAVFHRKLQMDLPAWMAQHLQRIDQRLCWEFGPPLRQNGKNRLVITPESHKFLRPMVQTLLERAPRIDGWEFYPYRPAESAEWAHGNVQARVGREFRDVTARVARGVHNLIDVTYASPDFESSQTHRESAHAAFVFTESLLGEEAMDKWVGVISAEPAKKPGILSNLFGGGGGRERPATGAFFALERLKPTFDALAQSIRDQLPPRPWHEINVQADGHEWTGFKTRLADHPDQASDESAQADMAIGSTPFVAMAQAALCPEIFRSERFSRFGETFGYLKIADAGRTLNPDRRQKIEDAIDAALVPARLGRTLGGGTGWKHVYVELALTDVDRALEPLRRQVDAAAQALESENVRLPPQTWLLFHDPEFADEWIGLRDDTPPPAPPPPVSRG